MSFNFDTFAPESPSFHTDTGLSDFIEELLADEHDRMTFGEGTCNGLGDNGASALDWANWFDPTTTTSSAVSPTSLPFPALPAVWPAAFANQPTGEDVPDQFIPPLSPILPSVPQGEFEDPIEAFTRMITPTTDTMPAALPTFSSSATDFFAFSAAPSPHTFPALPVVVDNNIYYQQANPMLAPPPPAPAVGAGTPTLVLPDVIGGLVWESPDTVKTYIWDGYALPPMPAIRLWHYLRVKLHVLENSVGEDDKHRSLHRCLWPDCQYGDMLRNNLRKHVQTVHQKLKKRCENPGCMFTERSDMFNTRHKHCQHGPPGVRPEAVLVLSPY